MEMWNTELKENAVSSALFLLLFLWASPPVPKASGGQWNQKQNLGQWIEVYS